MPLTAEEIEYFNTVVDKIKHTLDFDFDINILDHETLYYLDDREALGLCWGVEIDGKIQGEKITIDEYFVHESYLAYTNPNTTYVEKTLEDVIAHELAHLKIWEHNNEFDKVQKKIYKQFKLNI